ncbi:DEAD/DEAH box helicase family protein [Candidatus Poriferisocius sp.]|uniref:restriction endonuclease n=1 Tax=Candidatus Poriferisocius sp. TaxID=3101276 RepID=UPI003B0228EB
MSTVTLENSDFYAALEELRSEADSLFGRGRNFERLMRQAFEAHPYEYGPARFEKVWLWADWPERAELGYGADIGIDLVARQTDAYGGGLCAIQCKNFAAGHQVPTSDVDSFLAASGTEHFASRILVVTSDLSTAGWTKVHKASPRCEVLDAVKLSSWPVRWLDFLDRPDDLEFDHRERHRPRRDQRDALDAIAKGYQSHSRGRLVMPCGTGKSLVAMWAAEENAGQAGTVLYLVPSIALMGQTMREWAGHRNIGHTYLGVCSDKTTGHRAEDGGDTARDLAELSMPVSTDREQIAEALARPAGNKMRVVFSTYQSLPVLSEALPSDFTFDLVICDEAHRTSGVDQPSTDEKSAFRLIHDEQQVPAQFRLFMTATQRIFTAAARARAATKDSDVYSMDDEELYGPLLYEMSFSDAVDRELLSDYEVLIVAHSESQLTAGMNNRLAAINSASGRRHIVTKEDAVKLLGCWDALADPNTKGVSPHRLTGQIAEVTKGGGKGHLHTAIAFTNTVKLSKAIAGPSSETAGLWEYVADEAPPPPQKV